MRRPTSAPGGIVPVRMPFPAILPMLLLAFLLTGCASRGGLSHVASGPLLEQCQKSCRQDDDYGVLSRNGCLQGCVAAQTRFPLRGTHYLSDASCREAVAGLDVQEQVRLMDAQCEDLWVTIHSRKGCKDAARAFYDALDGNMCRPDAR